jgi:hypothetical protein
MKKQNSYMQIIEKIFLKKFRKNSREVLFDREELINTAGELGLKLPKNIGDVIYSFRYRVDLPESIKSTAPTGLEWVIRPAGQSKYKFVVAKFSIIAPSKMLAETKIPNATPGVIEKYALSDEQALLAKLRYNRLIDIFTGLTCYSLQSHLRTHVPNLGQSETDEIYIGIDKKGAHYIIPIQAKGGSERLGIVQIEQDFAVCKMKFPNLICKPVAAQFISKDLIALFEFELSGDGVSITQERHYRLVLPEELTPEDLLSYIIRKQE